MQIKQIAIGRVKPYERNPRDNAAAVEKVADSLAEFGWQQPIVVDKDMVIVAGHTRYEAAKRLGMQKVPVHVAKDLTPGQIRAYRLADNKLAELAEWDDELLALELLELPEDYDRGALGFTEDEIKQLTGMVDGTDFPSLGGEKGEIQQLTVTLHDSQAEIFHAAIDAAKEQGEFGETGNENSNGNAVARICEYYLAQHAQ